MIVMRIPFQLFTSPANMGTSFSSIDFVELTPAFDLNVAQTRLAVNAHNGNAVVQDKLFTINDFGSAITVGMVWNSFDQKWRFQSGAAVKTDLTVLESLSRIFSSKVILIEPDGREVTYHKNENGTYQCEATNATGLSTLTINENSDNKYERFFPGNGIKEIFNKDGKLTKRVLLGGIVYVYQYDDKGNVNKISLPSGRSVNFEQDGNLSNIWHLFLNYRNQKTALADYEFDEYHVDLKTKVYSKDGSSYTTSYLFAEDKLEIDSDDETKSTLYFNQDNEINKYVDGENSSWLFSRNDDGDVFTVTDANEEICELTSDKDGHLLQFKLPQNNLPTKFKTDAGKIIEVVTPDKAVQTVTYNTETGLVEKDSKAQTETSTARYTEYLYNTTTGPLLGAKLVKVVGQDVDRRAKKFYVYNEGRELVYKITAEGRVTRYFYSSDAPSLRTEIRKLTLGFYDLSKVSLDQSDTFPRHAQLDLFWARLSNEQHSSMQVVKLEHDHFGRLNQETKFSKLDNKFEGITDSLDNAISHKSLDEKGGVKKLEVASVSGSSPVFSSLVMSRDGVDRVTSIKQGTQLKRETRKTYEGNKEIVSHPNGLVEKSKKNASGILTSTKRFDSKNPLAIREKVTELNKNGTLRATTDENGIKIHYVRDKSGQIKYAVTSAGDVEEYFYDDTSLPISTYKYSIKVTALIPDNFNVHDISTVLSKDKNVLMLNKVYDAFGQLIFEETIKPDPNTYGALKRSITQHFYHLGNRIKTVQYANSTFSPDDKNRVTHYFYDKDDLLAGEQVYSKAENSVHYGYTKKLVRDGAGNITHELVYKAKSAMAMELENVIPLDNAALVTRHWYDNIGRKIATLDADNYLTSYTYYANGKVKSEVTYSQKQNINRDDRVIILPAANNDDLVILHEYDDFDRKCRTTNYLTGLEVCTEYDLMDNITARILCDIKTGDIRKTLKDYNVFSEVQAEASERVVSNMRNENDKSNWVNHIYHPSNGLKLCTIDEKGQATLFYYDASARPVLEIRPNGAVIKYQYHAICQKPHQIYQYINRIKPNVLMDLMDLTIARDGFFDANYFDTILTKDNHDQAHQLEYDAEGLLIKTVAPTSATHTFERNAFNEVEREEIQVDKNKTKVVTNEIDPRGNTTLTTIGGVGVESVETRAEYDDPLSRPTLSINPLGLKTITEYTGLRQQEITQTDPSDFNKTGKKTVEKDAFLRPKSETDWNNLPLIDHQYNERDRQHTLLSTVAVERNITETKNAFGEVVKSKHGKNILDYKREQDGQIGSVTYPDGSFESDTFDIKGLPETHTDRMGKSTELKRNNTDQVTKRIEAAHGETKTTIIAPDVFNNSIMTVAPNGLITTLAIEEAGVQTTQVKDIKKHPNDTISLQLQNQETHNFVGSVTKISQGSVNEPAMYVEAIERDVLDREITRHIIGAGLIHEQAWDTAGHLVMSKDGNGSIVRHIYDARGNVRFTIDAEGFVEEKTYDLNNRELIYRNYVIPLAIDVLSVLTTKETPVSFSARVQKSNQDALRYRVYDRDGSPRFELNVLEKSENGLLASVKEWKYEYSNLYSKRISYAKPVNIANLDLTKPDSLTALSTLMQLPEASSPKDQTKEVCRNAAGKGILVRDSEGFVTEKRYGQNDKCIKRIRYAKKCTLNTWPQNINNIKQAISAKDLSKKALDETDPDNRVEYNIYDQFGNLRFIIDGEKFVQQFEYNEANQPVKTIYYAKSMKDILSLKDQNALNISLGTIDTLSPKAAIDLMLSAVKKMHHVDNVVLEDIFDIAGRHYAQVDGEGFKELETLNPLGLGVFRKDKRNITWERKFNNAKLIEKETSPKVNVAIVSQNADTQKLEQKIIETAVENTFTYDDAFNQESINYASNLAAENQQRTVGHTHNKKHELISTKVDKCQIDDGSADLPEKFKRPEVTKSVTTDRVLDYWGRELVHVNENGHLYFHVHDANGRECFVIDGQGYVTEYVYETAFSHHDKVIQHESAISVDELLKHSKTGFTLAEMRAFKLVSHQDRSVTSVTDRRGIVVNTKKDQITTANAGDEGSVTREDLAPERQREINAFGEATVEKELTRLGNYDATRRFFDNNGNEILTVSPSGHVTVSEYGHKSINPEKPGYLLLKRVEYSVKLTITKDHKLEDIRKLLPKLSEDKGARIYDYKYDKRCLEIEVTITSGECFYKPKFENGQLVLGEPTHSATVGKKYDENGDIIAYTIATGDTRHLFRDNRGDVVVETGFAKATSIDDKDENGQPKQYFPVTRHHVDAHRVAVGSTTYAAKVKVGEIVIDDKAVMPVVSENPDQDEASLILMDNRGHPVVMQMPNGHLKFMTYDGVGQSVRGYQWVSGYQQDKRNAEPTYVEGLHLQANRNEYDNREKVVMAEKFDDAREGDNKKSSTHFDINAFSECVAEGAEKNNMTVQRSFNKIGTKTFTNEEGAPTVSFPNAKGEEAATFRSATKDLSHYKDKPEQAAKELLEADYDKHIGDFQRTLSLHDQDGNVNKKFYPWSTRRAEHEPEHKQITFTLLDSVDGKKGTFIAWRALDEKFIKPVFKLKTKNEIDWNDRGVENKGTLFYVDISELPADLYEYQLDYYYFDLVNKLDADGIEHQVKEPDLFPSYRAAGEVVLDTKNYASCNKPLSYLNDSNQLVIFGKCEGVSGIEIQHNDGSIKRLAGTPKGGSLVVDLQHENSGDYEYKYLFGYDEVEVPTSTEGYSLQFYTPKFQFTGPGDIQPISGTLPVEIKHIDKIMSPATTSWPFHNMRFGKNNSALVMPGMLLTKAIVSGLDSNSQPYHLGSFLTRGNMKGSNVKYDYRFIVDYPYPVTAASFYQIKTPQSVAPQAVRLGDHEIYQLQPWAGNTYIIPSNVNYHSSGKILTLNSAKVSQNLDGKIKLQVKNKSNVLLAQEFNINDFNIDHYSCNGFRAGSVLSDKQAREFYHYEWQGNLPSDAQLFIFHGAINGQKIFDISELPKSDTGLDRFFQASTGDIEQSNIPPSFMSLEVEINGDRFRFINGLNYQSVSDRDSAYSKTFQVENDYSQIVSKRLGKYHYGNMSVLYLSPIPANASQAEIEVLFTTVNGKDEWRAVPCTLSNKGVVIQTNTFTAGQYQYRIRLTDKENKLMDLSEYGLQRDAVRDQKNRKNVELNANNRWSYSTFTVKKGLPGQMMFTSKSEQDIREVVKPISLSEHDRWNNEEKSISPANYAAGIEHGDLESRAELKSFNFNNQVARTVSPAVKHTDEHGNTEAVRLTTETLYRADGPVIGDIAPNDHGTDVISHLNFVNTAGETLLSQDADGVQQKNTVNMLGKPTSVSSPTTGTMQIDYKREGTKSLEIRTRADKKQEIIAKNERYHVIYRKDTLMRETFGDFDMDGHEILHVNADFTSIKQQFDLRTNSQLFVTNENDEIKSWKNDYFGNCLSYTDLAGQVIKYLLNFNKQVIEELGDLSGVTKDRGRVLRPVPDGKRHDGSDYPTESNQPPKRHLRNIRNEAGLVEEIVDLGAQLTTRLSHDEEGYTDKYFFINDEGRLYQATKTDFDSMHRIVKITDARYMIHLGYDKNSNRRFANAHMIDKDELTDLNSVRENEKTNPDYYYRESWYKYTRANRPIVRDGMLDDLDKEIKLAPGQGTAFTYDPVKKDQVKQQENQTIHGDTHVKGMTYLDNGLLEKATTINKATGEQLATLARKYDDGNRVTQTKQNGCDIVLAQEQPDKHDAATYLLQTYVVTFQPTTLYYYSRGSEGQRIDFASDAELVDVIKKYGKATYESVIANPAKIAELKGAIKGYHDRNIGEETDDNVYQPKTNGILTTTHTSAKRKNEHTVKEKMDSGEPLVETNVKTEPLPDGSTYELTEKTESKYARGDSNTLMTSAIVDRKINRNDLKVEDFKKTAQAFTTVNSNNSITSFQGDIAGGDPTTINETFRYFVTNSQNCIVFKETAKGRNYYFYAEKRPGKTVLMGYFGDLPEDIKSNVKKKKKLGLAKATGKGKEREKRPVFSNFDTNFEAVSPSYPGVMPTEYIAPRDMTYREIANEINYTGYASTIAQANGGDESTVVKQGNRIVVPNLYFEVADTAWNGAMPSVDKIIGSLYAVASTPQVSLKPKKEHINWVEKFVEVAACVAVMVLAPELFAVMMGATLGAATASLTAATTAQAMIAYGAAGAVSSAVGQSIAISFGTQKGFDVKSMAVSSLTAAVSAGVVKQTNYALGNTSLNSSLIGKTTQYVVRAEASTLAQQATLVATRQQSRIDWKATQTAAFNAAINMGADSAFGENTSPDGLKAANLAASNASTNNKVMSAGVNALGSSLVNAAVYHQRVSAEGLAVNTAGAMGGTYAGDKSLNVLLANQRAHVQTQRARSIQGGHHLNRQPAPHHTGQKRLDAVKEAKQTRATRWADSSNATSWQDKYKARQGEFLSRNWDANSESSLSSNGLNAQQGSTANAIQSSWTDSRFMQNVVAFNAGIEATRDGITHSIIHPVDTLTNLGVTIWDGYNAISDLAFGVSSAGSRERNALRGAAINQSIDNFANGDGIVRTRMLAELGSGVILGGAGVTRMGLQECVGIERSALRQRVLGNIAESKAGRTERNIENFAIFSRRSTAIEFYSLNGFQEENTLAHMRGIDFTQPVEIYNLKKGTPVVQYMLPNRSVGNYFAPLGMSGSQLGIYTSGRSPVTFFALQDTKVLKSTAFAMVDDYSMTGYGWKIETQGGGTQYFSPSTSVWERR